MVVRSLAISLAIYWAELHLTGPHQTDDCADVICDNLTGPHQTNVCRATTDSASTYCTGGPALAPSVLVRY